MNNLKINVLKAIYESGDGLSEKELVKKLDIAKKTVKKLEQALAEMKRYGDLTNKKGVWRLKNTENYFEASVARINPKSGFIVREGEVSEEFFVRGKDLRGAVPGDIVLAKKTAPAGDGWPQVSVIEIAAALARSGYFLFLAESSLISLTRSMINPAKSMIILSIAIETTSSPERIEVWMWSTVPFVASGQALKLSIM